jgi:hypothetical protein
MKNPKILEIKILVCAALFLAVLTPCNFAADGIPRLAWDDRAGMEENIGNEVFVTGTIRNIGNTGDGGITFLNFGGPRDNAFVAVVFQKSYGSFPDGFSEFEGQNVTIRGVMENFQNKQLQIRVENADQITFGDAEATGVN